jgi:hypothetical protein
MFEKILKSDQVSTLSGGTLLPNKGEPSEGPGPQRREYQTEAKPERESALVTQMQGEPGGQNLVTSLAKGALSAQAKKEGPGAVMGGGIISSGVRALPDSGKRRLFNSGSTAGYNVQSSNSKEEPQSFQSLTAANDAGKQRICRQLLGPMH